MAQLLYTLSLMIVAALGTVPTAALAENCRDHGTCEDVFADDAVRASAMLQVKTEGAPQPHVSTLAETSGIRMHAAHLKESRSCLPSGLQEKHLQSVRRYAALLAVSPPQQECTCDPSLPGEVGESTGLTQVDTELGAANCTCSELQKATGDSAPINPQGFTAVTKLCCPMETETWFNRLLDSNGFQICSKPHMQGLMHWFTCVPDMDPEYVMEIIMNGNPCKYWAPKDQECPELTPQCRGNWCR